MKKLYYYIADKILNYIERKNTTLEVDHDFFDDTNFVLLDMEEDYNV